MPRSTFRTRLLIPCRSSGVIRRSRIARSSPSLLPRSRLGVWRRSWRQSKRSARCSDRRQPGSCAASIRPRMARRSGRSCTAGRAARTSSRLLWTLRVLIEHGGSLEGVIRRRARSRRRRCRCGARRVFAARTARRSAPGVSPCARDRPGVFYFFAQPSTGSACKRLNLFLRWMVRSDGVDPGGWTSVQARQLVVPLDTHTIRVGPCLRLTRRTSPGWKMAVDITRALRVLDPDDPVRYDFALCHLSMMADAALAPRAGQTACPLAGLCHPRAASRAARRRR